jgi:cell division protein FtsW
VLFGTVLVLLAIGSTAVFSSTTPVSQRYFGNSTAMFLRHMSMVGLGLITMFLFSRIDYRVTRRLAMPMIGASIVLLAMTLVPDFPWAVTRKGATRWIDLGFTAVQPAELAKMALVVYIAHILSQGEGRIRDYRRGFAPICTVAGVFVVLLMKQPNYGNVLAISLLTGAMLFFGGARLTHMMASGACVLPVVAILGAQQSHIARRFNTFLQGGDPQNAGYQIHQSFVALGSGGLIGMGPGEGRQAEFFLPDSHTDFVFAILGEEFGLVGTVLVVALFAMFLWRGVRVAHRAPDLFGRFLALGLTMMVALVAMMNILVVLGLVPTAGMPLPFISYGGSAMVMNLGAVGILLSISARTGGRRRRVVA